jgi:hypothetical protein
MALVSPGVEVSIIDESAYRSSATNSVPYILLATAQNKVNAAGTGVAQGTTAANANNTYLITSQRELVNTFGNPFFYNTTAGTPINGYELNEYGLLAAYSVLGVSNRAYVQRVDVDLAELAASLARPTGSPANNTWWLDTSESQWGIFKWQTTSFVAQTPIVITSTDDLDGSIPKSSIGSVGSYAVVATNTNLPVYYKNHDNDWTLVGSDDWQGGIPTVNGTETSPTFTANHEIDITPEGGVLTSVSIGSGTTLAELITEINDAGITGVTAANRDNRLAIYLSGVDSVILSEGDDGLGGTGTILDDAGITAGTYYAPVLQQSAHTSIPRWRSTDTEPRPNGSVWIKTTSVNSGANLVVKRYSTATNTFVQQAAPIYASDQAANYELDRSGGGENIAQDTTYAMYNSTDAGTATLKLYQRASSGDTIVVGDDTAPSLTDTNTFTISASVKGSTSLITETATLDGTDAEAFVTAISSANVANVEARVLSTGAIEIKHTQGGVIVLKDTSGTPVADAGFNNTVDGVKVNYTDGSADGIILSNWVPMLDPDESAYSASSTAPGQDPVTGTKWYYSTISDVDIMIHDGTNWKGYLNVSNDTRGFDLTSTSPAGPQVGASAPTKQSDDSVLEYGDLWIDTSDLENYPVIKRWEAVDGTDQWVTIDNTDQTTENGVVFADARWATSGSVDPVSDDFATIKALASSDYLDIDAPDASLYPAGTLLFNTRRSGYNVKEFRNNYFNATDFPDDTLPTEKNAWVTVSGTSFGRKAQREIIVSAMQSAVDSNTEIREEQRVFNLLAAPGYPELIPNLVALNNDRNNTGFVIGDTPLRLDDSGTSLVNWASNANNDGLSINDEYLGVFYPSGQTTDLSGNTVVVPASHMMMRTFIRNDEVGYPWLAPAGTRRGNIDNASALGYINETTGEFVSIANRLAVRDTLYENNVNPLTFIPGTGLVNYGNKTTASGTALDRINVARLVAYVRNQVESIGKGFIFEPNDKLTRNEIKNQIEGLMNDITAKRGIYDYLVVCDESNNTPTRIDRNELYVDIAIEPSKAVEYVYIPIRIKNTGEIDAGI